MKQKIEIMIDSPRKRGHQEAKDWKPEIVEIINDKSALNSILQLVTQINKTN